MTAELTIDDCWGDGSWWVLSPNGGRASVEGFADEWRSIALGLLCGESVYNKRCAYDAKNGTLYSPRNSYGEHDCTEVEDPKALAAEIRRVLGPREVGR